MEPTGEGAEAGLERDTGGSGLLLWLLSELWVHLRPCLWKRTPIAEYQAAHDVSRPLAGLSKAKWEAELVRIADEIEAALTKV